MGGEKKLTPPARVAVPDDDRCRCWVVRGLERRGSWFRRWKMIPSNSAGRARLDCDGHEQQIDIAQELVSLRHLNEMTFNI